MISLTLNIGENETMPVSIFLEDELNEVPLDSNVSKIKRGEALWDDFGKHVPESVHEIFVVYG